MGRHSPNTEKRDVIVGLVLGFLGWCALGVVMWLPHRGG